MMTSSADDLPDMDQISEDIVASKLEQEPEFIQGKALAAFNERIADVLRDADSYGYLNL